jgi:hypothetical protein
MHKLRKSYWQDSPNVTQRRKLNEDIIRDAYDRRLDADPMQRFAFYVGKQKVCEQALLIVLGLITVNSRIGVLTQWNKLKEEICGKTNKFIKMSMSAKIKSKKFDHAVTFIKWVTDIFAEPGYGEHSVAPYYFSTSRNF